MDIRRFPIVLCVLAFAPGLVADRAAAQMQAGEARVENNATGMMPAAFNPGFTGASHINSGMPVLGTHVTDPSMTMGPFLSGTHAAPHQQLLAPSTRQGAHVDAVHPELGAPVARSGAASLPNTLNLSVSPAVFSKDGGLPQLPQPTSHLLTHAAAADIATPLSMNDGPTATAVPTLDHIIRAIQTARVAAGNPARLFDNARDRVGGTPARPASHYGRLGPLVAALPASLSAAVPSHTSDAGHDHALSSNHAPPALGPVQALEMVPAESGSRSGIPPIVQFRERTTAHAPERTNVTAAAPERLTAMVDLDGFGNNGPHHLGLMRPTTNHRSNQWTQQRLPRRPVHRNHGLRQRTYQFYHHLR